MSLVTSLTLPHISAVLNIGDFVLTLTNVVLQICHVIKRKKEVLVTGNVLKDTHVHKNIKLPRDLIMDYDLITTAYKLHGMESVKEVVITQRHKVVSATEIKDIAYVFDEKK